MNEEVENTNNMEIVDKIAKYLNVEAKILHQKELKEDKAIYIYEEAKGGRQVIVSEDGTFLGATSAVSFEKMIEEYRLGRRNGNINNIK
ncbi:MAG: hypothetical protein HFJ48_00150 [Clostridia bacterium]|nr:hypothetical protein [Clostridia bacterium]